MKQLFLEDLENCTIEKIKNHLLEEWEAEQEIVDKFNILIAYESVGSWGCDSSAWYLLREKKTKKLFEVHGSHCSCNGFEGQFKPEETTLEYLKSDKFYLSTGGYDENETKNISDVKYFIKKMKSKDDGE